MKTTYSNRYGDNIVFEQTGPSEITMSGYSQWYRAGWANDYSDAYEVYENLCRASDHPDKDLFIDDPASNSTRKMSYQEFADHMISIFHNEKAPLHPLVEYIKSDKNTIDMFDPSGGPYISLGMDVGRYFDGKIGKQIVEDIKILENRVVLTTKSK